MKIGSTIRAASAAVCILAGCVLTVGVIVAACNRHEMAVDMVNAYVPAARAMLHGGSPYGLRPLASQEAFVYPPVAAVAVAPLTLLSGVGLQAVSVVLTVAAVLGALWLAGVRDPRCFLAALGCCLTRSDATWRPALSGPFAVNRQRSSSPSSAYASPVMRVNPPYSLVFPTMI